MKKITDSYLREHIRSALGRLTPDKAEQIWEQPVEKAVGNEWFLDGVGGRQKNTGKVIKILSSVAACLAVCFLSYYMMNLRTDATVYLDVNPAIELQVSRNEKVLLAEAKNQDGEVVLEGMDLKNTDIDVAVNAILGSMVRHGYLNEAQDMVLLSVDCKDQEKADALRAKLSGDIYQCLASLLGSGSIFDQTVHVDDELEELSEKYGITPGKAALLQKLTAENPDLKYAELARLPMKELVLYLERTGIDIRDFANYTGTGFYDMPDLENEDGEDSGRGEEDSDRDEEDSARENDEEEESEPSDSEDSRDNVNDKNNIDLDDTDDPDDESNDAEEYDDSDDDSDDGEWDD